MDTRNRFAIVAVYVDDMNLIRTPKNYQIFKKSDWNERFEENKILSQLVDQAYNKWIAYLSISLCWKNLKACQYG